MTNLKAYVEILNKNGNREKHIWTLEEAKKALTEKQFEKLVSFEGIRTKKIVGYVA